MNSVNMGTGYDDFVEVSGGLEEEGGRDGVVPRGNISYTLSEVYVRRLCNPQTVTDRGGMTSITRGPNLPGPGTPSGTY